jgi:polysaccharide export outer membrane protein
VACLLILAACTSLPASNEAPPITVHPEAVTNYHIGVDDQLQITVWQNPDLSVNVPVRPDGKITVPLIGDVEAGGKTPTEVSSAIQDKLKAYIRDPQVAVIVTQLRSHEYLTRVSVTGAVQHPVSAPYHQGMTVLDAILAAGGVNAFAAADDTVLYRKVNGATRAYRVRLDQILQSGDLATNYPLQPGDVITVPTRSF